MQGAGFGVQGVGFRVWGEGPKAFLRPVLRVIKKKKRASGRTFEADRDARPIPVRYILVRGNGRGVICCSDEERRNLAQNSQGLGFRIQV